MSAAVLTAVPDVPETYQGQEQRDSAGILADVPPVPDVPAFQHDEGSAQVAGAILAELHEAQVTVRARGDSLSLSPRDRVTPELLELVKAYKPAILEALAAAEREAALAPRRALVVARLEAQPDTRYAFDVQGAPLVGPARDPVSVIVAVRLADGKLATGELSIPADRWDAATFMAYMQAQGRPS
jgi:hypothetical protein